MRLALLGFALGICLLQQQAELLDWVDWPLIVLAAAACGATLIAANLIQRPAWRGALTVLAGLAALSGGFFWATWRAELRLADALPPAWEGRDVRLVGVVDELPQPGGDGSQRFAFAVEQVLTPGAMLPTRVSLAWYPLRQKGELTPPPELHAGERWQLTARLRRPHGNVNPQGFDFEAWALERHLRASGYVRQDPENHRVTVFAGRPGDYLERQRETFRARIQQALPGAAYAGAIVALAIGDQRAIPAAQWQIFNRTGVGHLISISGLHVTLFATLAGALAFALWRRSFRLTLLLPAHQAAAALGALAALAYVLIAGFQVPAQRTLYMLLVAALGLWLGRPGSASTVLLWALTVVLGIDPWAVLAPGFWLSFGAVSLLVYVGGQRAGERGAWHAAATAQWAMSLGLVPLTLLFFQQVSLVSPFANAVAIPVVSFVVVPLALLYLLIPFDPLLALAHGVFALLAQGLEAASRLPTAIWQQHAPPAWAIALGLAGVLWMLAPRGLPGRWLGALWLAPAFLVLPPRPEPGEAWFTVLDVGQGTAVVVRTAKHTLLYDTGARFSLEADAGNRLIAPYLRASGSPRLGALVVSHQDSDHSGGARSVMQILPIDWVLSSLPDEHELIGDAQAARLDHWRCVAGQTWDWDGVRFSVLHPAEAAYANVRLKTNDRSCVIKVQDARGAMLLTGDIEAQSERELLARRPEALAAEVLLVPHHGSKTSSTRDFIAAVAPRVAVVTLGYRNRHGHPKEEVLARYRERGIALWRTDLEGAIELRFAPDRPSVAGYRSVERRYWREVPRREEAGEATE
ncbi:MAG: DNA internalization-related competence protein ComEC/Rec2 [Betaproteobacteria bacterium]|nr:DNA internalization-related competence protein ComEC/Rec2 [Betaproteobacteria bacterium]